MLQITDVQDGKVNAMLTESLETYLVIYPNRNAILLRMGQTVQGW